MDEDSEAINQAGAEGVVASSWPVVIFRDRLAELIDSKDFGSALLAYFDALGEASSLRAEADASYASALLGADAKNDAGRKAQADIAAALELLAARDAETCASVLRHLVLHLRADRGTLEILEGKAER